MNEWFRNIATKTINGHEFVLQLQKTFDYDNNTGEFFETGFDYIISGPNWLSGLLKAQGMNEQEIFEYWDQVTMQDVKDAWETYYERMTY